MCNDFLIKQQRGLVLLFQMKVTDKKRSIFLRFTNEMCEICFFCLFAFHVHRVCFFIFTHEILNT